MALRFFARSWTVDAAQVESNAAEAYALEGCTLAALDFVVYLAAIDPLAAEDIVQEALPAIEETLRQLHEHWPNTSAAMLRRTSQFEPIWTWWNARLATVPETAGSAVQEVSATLNRFHPPERRAEMERCRSARTGVLAARKSVSAAPAQLAATALEQPASPRWRDQPPPHRRGRRPE